MKNPQLEILNPGSALWLRLPRQVAPSFFLHPLERQGAKLRSLAVNTAQYRSKKITCQPQPELTIDHS
jgi:hypothetical protein